MFAAVLDEEDEHTLKGRSLEEVTLRRRRRGAHVRRHGHARARQGGDVGSVVTFDDVTELVVRAAHRGVGGRRTAHRARDQEPADADPACRPSACARSTRKPSPSDRETFERLTTPSSGRSATSSAWSTSSPSSRACPSRRWDGTICATPCRSRSCCSARATREIQYRAEDTRQAAAHVLRPPPDHAGGHQPREERRARRSRPRASTDGKTKAGRAASRRS